MKCPHCSVEFHDFPKGVQLGTDVDGWWGIIRTRCSACDRDIYKLVCAGGSSQSAQTGFMPVEVRVEYLVRPKVSFRPPPPQEAPVGYATDYLEACLVLADSTKASAALSRRCLQNMLRGEAHIRSSDLASEIQEVLDSGKLPTHIAESIDAVRNIGNFAAHPIKSKSTGEIVEVEPGEAEWNLDVLESLFDFYFVQPEKTRQRRAALNQKLADAGKPPVK
jgi:hypothetical protein